MKADGKNVFKAIGRELKKARTVRGLSVRAAAMGAGINRPTLERIEAGKNSTGESMYLYGKFLSITVFNEKYLPVNQSITERT